MIKELFAGKYRTDSMRLQGWDYTSDGMYFITICTQEKEWRFGKVEKGKTILNETGKIVREEWLKTGDIRDNVVLGEWVIMPDHFHAIIAIRNRAPDVETSRRDVSEKWPGDRSIVSKSPEMSRRKDFKTGPGNISGSNPLSETPHRDGLKTGLENVPGSNALSETPHRGVSTPTKNAGLKPGSLGAIIGQFKSIVTKRIEKTGNNDFAWQPGYYDHIIRNDQDLKRIRGYIILNPERLAAGRG